VKKKNEGKKKNKLAIKNVYTGEKWRITQWNYANTQVRRKRYHKIIGFLFCFICVEPLNTENKHWYMKNMIQKFSITERRFHFA